MRWLGTAARSAQPALSVKATTRVPAAGPLPSAACLSTTPAMSWPGRQPSGRIWNSRNSPRLSEKARISTSASLGAGCGSITSRNSTGALPPGVLTRASIRPSPASVEPQIDDVLRVGLQLALLDSVYDVGQDFVGRCRDANLVALLDDKAIEELDL